MQDDQINIGKIINKRKYLKEIDVGQIIIPAQADRILFSDDVITLRDESLTNIIDLFLYFK